MFRSPSRQLVRAMRDALPTFRAEVDATLPAVRKAVEGLRQDPEYCNVCENCPCLGNHPPVAIV